MKKKKTPCISLIITLIIGMAMVGVEAGAPQPLPLIYVDPPTYTAATLDEFTIDINIANVSNLTIVEFKLGYNTTILDAINVIQGPFMKIGYNVMLKEINDSLGYVYVTIAILSGGQAEGNGTLATITLKPTYFASASCDLDLYNTVLTDPAGQPMTHEVADGYYEFTILNLTVTKSKQSYYADENIDIYGNLKKDGSPIDGLVALEVKDPSDKTILLRTLQTGTTPPVGNITITDVYPCDEWGNPKNSFKRGEEIFYFSVTVKNNDTIERKLTVAVNAYDGKTVPFGVMAIGILISPGTSTRMILGIPIPEWASIGTASTYASAFTGYPSLDGTAYCPEESATFEITGSTAALGTQKPNNPPAVKILTNPTGSYSLTFKLISGEEGLGDRQSRIGNHTVYVSSSYQGLHDEDNTTFMIKVPGDVDGDGDVDIYDLTKLALSWRRSPPDPKYNPDADFNGDGIVNIYDLTKLALNWHKW